MHIDRFKAIAKQISELERTGVKFDVAITNDNTYTRGNLQALFEPVHYEVKSLKQLSEVQAILAKPLQLNSLNSKIDFSKVKTEPVSDVIGVLQKIRTSPGEKAKYPTLKFYSNIANERYYVRMFPQMIIDDPPEELEEGVTYRYIGTKAQCQFCIPHTHPLYNYLDKGSFYLTLRSNKTGKEKVYITNEMTVDTYLCLVMLTQEPDALSKHLQNECYINAATAKVTRIKLEKELAAAGDNYRFDTYTNIRELTLKEYEKTANAGLLDRLIKGALPSGSFNQIKLTKTSAQYEDIRIQADNLLEILYAHVVFDDRTDIYGLITSYIGAMIDQVEEHVWLNSVAELAPKADGQPHSEAELAAHAEQLLALADQTAERSFQINGIDITIKRTNKNSRRYVNEIPINKEEVEKVCFRASCFTNQEIFDKFVNSVKKMSLKWHDAIAMGVGIKIHDGMSAVEYRNPEAPMSAPKLKFRIIDEDVRLFVSEEKSVKIKFNDALKRIATLNRKTNDGNSFSMGYGIRNATWARGELIRILRECCTFEEKTLKTKMQLIEGTTDKYEEVPDLDANGKKQYNKKNVCVLSEEDAKFIEKMAREYQLKALEKSKLFLANAVKATGAKLERFNGEDHYIVEGKMRKYAVHASNNKVFNYDTKSYICIVEPGHQISIGGDATALRLYALKNDAVTVDQIGTLRHG